MATAGLGVKGILLPAEQEEGLLFARSGSCLVITWLRTFPLNIFISCIHSFSIY